MGLLKFDNGGGVTTADEPGMRTNLGGLLIGSCDGGYNFGGVRLELDESFFRTSSTIWVG